MKTTRMARLAFRQLLYVLAVIAAKLVVHRLGWEIIPLNAIFSALIGATVFLMGFLISGVMSDYKESEKIPGDIACASLAIADEVSFIAGKMSDNNFLRSRLTNIYELTLAIRRWFYREIGTAELMLRIENLSQEFVLLERHAQPNYIARLKQEQSTLRRLIVRVHVIRETEFALSGYFLASTSTVLLLAGMVFLEIEPFYESLFFVGLVAYLLLFLLRLIGDLDNPFGYYDRDSFEDVSLKPIVDAVARLKERIDELPKSPAPGCQY